MRLPMRFWVCVATLFFLPCQVMGILGKRSWIPPRLCLRNAVLPCLWPNRRDGGPRLCFYSEKTRLYAARTEINSQGFWLFGAMGNAPFLESSHAGTLWSHANRLWAGSVDSHGHGQRLARFGVLLFKCKRIWLNAWNVGRILAMETAFACFFWRLWQGVPHAVPASLWRENSTCRKQIIPMIICLLITNN